VKFRVRCPSCTKLYEVESKDILNEAPLFQCITCETRFSFEVPTKDSQQIQTFVINSPHDLKFKEEPVMADRSSNSRRELSEGIEAGMAVGFTAPVVKGTLVTKNLVHGHAVKENSESGSQTRACPKCGAINNRRSTECYSCHVIFERLEGLPLDPLLRAQPSLVRKWKPCWINFTNEDLHNDFIRSCHELDALRFAMMKYEEIKSAQGGDALCDQMIAKINSLMIVGLSQKSRTKEPQTPKKPQWQKFAYWAPYVLSLFLITWGMLSLGHRNLIGLGVALFCLATGVIMMAKGKISVSDFLINRLAKKAYRLRSCIEHTYVADEVFFLTTLYIDFSRAC